MTTIHAYTGDQNILDNSHKDLRRPFWRALYCADHYRGSQSGWACIAGLDGKLDGSAVRANRKCICGGFTFLFEKECDVASINAALTGAANGHEGNDAGQYIASGID